MLRVLIITKTRGGGGTEKHIAGLIAPLAKRGIHVEIAYTEDGFWRLYRRIYDGRFDLVHMFLPRPYVLGSLACELALHHNRIMSRRSLRSCYQTPWIRRLEGFLHKRTQYLVGNSPAVVDELRQEAPGRRVGLIRNGVIPMELKWVKPSGFNIVCVGNAFPYKGHKDLMAAMRRVGPGMPEPWKLIFIGRGTEKYGGFNVFGAGYHDDIAPWLAHADLFVLPSHEEGSSNALLEAMASGIPVIATNVGGNRDAIIPGQTGLLVPPQDPAKLGLAIMAMVNDPMIRAEFAANAKQYVAKKFSFERCIDDYEALYRAAAERTGTVHQSIHQAVV